MPPPVLVLVLVVGAAALFVLLRRDARRAHADRAEGAPDPKDPSGPRGPDPAPAAALPSEGSSSGPGVGTRDLPILMALAHRIEGGTLELPLLAESAGKLLALCSDPDCDPLEIAATIDQDPALSAHVLRVANSAAYAPATSIESLNEAVARLGTVAVRDISLLVTMRERVMVAKRHETRLRELWRAAAASAAFARMLAERSGRDPSIASLGALLHDCGKPVVLQGLHDLSREHGVEVSDPIFEEAQRRFHASVGAKLAESWSLHPAAAASARWHGDPFEVTEHREAVLLVHVANRITKAVKAEDVALLSVLDDPALEELGLRSDALAAIAEVAPAVMESASTG